MRTGGRHRRTALIAAVGLALVGTTAGCSGSTPSPSAGAATASAPTSGTTGPTTSPASTGPSVSSSPSPRRTTPSRHIVNRSELTAGMCVTEPTGELIDNSLYEQVPCTKPHRYELGVKLELTRVASVSNAAIEKAALAACGRSTLPAQVARLNRKGHVYTYVAFFPTTESWKDGSRGVECFLAMIKERDLPSRALLKP